MRIGSLFAGIGGFDLAARWMGWTTAWVSEIDPYANSVLHKHWPGVPNHGDITKLRGDDVEWVHMLTGGFPCQDISSAGKKAGIGGVRSRLWSEFARVIGEVRPNYVVIENSAHLEHRGLDVVLSDLEDLGYAHEVIRLSACTVGATHLRRRLFIVAYPDDGSKPTRTVYEEARRLSPDARSLRDRWPTIPRTLRMAHGVPSGVDRLRCLGNAVVPQAAHFIFRAIQGSATRRAFCVPIGDHK